MSDVIFDEYQVRKLPPRERLDKVTHILKTENDEAIRWDAVWLAGEITEIKDIDPKIVSEIADLLAWVLENDDNGIVKHEAGFQIGVRNMRNKIYALENSALFDESEIARHESIEALGLMRAQESRPVLERIVNNKNESVSARETAIFVLKRLDRVRGEYKVENIL